MVDIDPSKPTRDQLEKVAQGDNRLLRAFERLFEVSGEELPESIEEINSAIDELSISSATKVALPSPVRPDQVRGILNSRVVFVGDKWDFPAAQSGVIQLDADTVYLVFQEVDLLGDRISCAANNTISGYGTNISRLLSTGLSGNALITSTGTVGLGNIAIEADIALDLNGSSGDFIDWISVNFENCATIGTIANYDNAVFINLGLINSANLTFDGEIGTIGFGDSLLFGRAGETTVIIPDTLTITRRFRAKFCAIPTPTGGTGIDFSASATVPDEGYILFECSFTGDGAALNGVLGDSNSAMFTGNTGIDNSRYFANYYMTNNATATTIAANTPTKIEGTTTAAALNEKFSHSDNRATYTGAVTRVFQVQAWAALSANNNNVLRLYVAKNGIAITDYFSEGTANSGGRAEGVSTGATVELETGDYVEIFTSNESASVDVTGQNLNVIVSNL